MTDTALTNALSMALDKIRRAQKHMKNAVSHDDEPVFLLMHFAQLCQDGSVPVSALKEAMGVSAAAATQFIKKLERFDYVVREPDPLDRRIVNVSLSAKGRQKVLQAKANMQSALEGLVEVLGKEDTQRFIDLLNRTTSYLEKEFNQ